MDTVNGITSNYSNHTNVTAVYINILKRKMSEASLDKMFSVNNPLKMHNVFYHTVFISQLLQVEDS